MVMMVSNVTGFTPVQSMSGLSTDWLRLGGKRFQSGQYSYIINTDKQKMSSALDLSFNAVGATYVEQ